MTPRSIQYILRSLAETGPPISDADLLRDFAAKDEAAFAELVRRRGRLVWSVCRQLTRSDTEADDAFQATFLVLLQHAKKIREAGKLSAWLHGVAFKVCTKARRTAQRREAREHRTAAREGHGSAVPDSAWDRALAAIHEEVAKLPETLRVPFVLCCLEGIGVTEAAERLGWKLGTLSGRLTRAKDAVLAKLEARGVTLGIVASVGVVSVPAAAKAEMLAQVGFLIPSSILQLSQGVIGMNVKSIKLLAAAVILACGLSLSVGTGWVASAEAQQSGASTPPVEKPGDEVKRLQAELDKAKAREEDQNRAAAKADYYTRLALDNVKRKPEPADFKTANWEYDLVDMAPTFDKVKFPAMLQERENAGWEFLGSTVLGPQGGTFQWLFRRAVKGAKLDVNDLSGFRVTPKSVEVEYAIPGTKKPDPEIPPKVEDAKSIEAEIAKLTEKLAGLRSTQLRVVATFRKEVLPLEPADFAALMSKMAEKKFGKGRAAVFHTAEEIEVRGDGQVGAWATDVVKSLAGK